MSAGAVLRMLLEVARIAASLWVGDNFSISN